MTYNIWADPERFLREPAAAAAALRKLDLPRVDHYYAALSEKGGIDLGELCKLSRCTPVTLTGNDHLKFRRLIAPFLSRSGLEQWAPTIAAGVDAGLETLAGSRSPDLVKDFTNPLFLHIMPRMLGFRVKEPDDFFEAVETTQRISEPYLSLPVLKKLNSRVAHLVGCFETDEDNHHQAGAPDSLLKALELHRDELPADIDLRYMLLGLLAGSNSATQSLAFALYGLLSGPAEDWRAAALPDWAQEALQPLLGLYQSTRTLVRVASSDTEVAGCPFHAGDPAIADVVGANRRLRALSGDPSAHMSFGAGAHKCPGQFLSEMIFEAAIPALARRFPQILLLKETCRFVTTPMMQVPTALPCDLASKTHRLSARMCDLRDTWAARMLLKQNETFAPPQMAGHLELLAEKGGINLDVAIHVARNAMFFMDGPRHAGLRDAVARHLGRSVLTQWQPTIDAAIGTCLDRLSAMAQPDLVEGFADPLRQLAVAPILGVSTTDTARFEAIAPDLQDILEPWLPLRELTRIQAIFNEALTLMREPDDAPQLPSLLGALLSDPPEGFDQDDLMAAVLVFYGASFNLTHTLANALHWILTLPEEERQGIAQGGWTDARLETIIALCSSPKYIYRTARHDLRLDGLDVKAGDTIRLTVHALNRNADVGAGHFSFGRGTRRCIGSGLTRIVLRRAIPAFFQRYPNVSLVAQGQRYFPMSQTVAMQKLPCILSEGRNEW